MNRFASAEDLVAQLRPELPVLCLRPHAAARAARWFLSAFPGDVIYALKANDAPPLVSALIEAGVSQFDVASGPELETLSALPSVRLCLMHPIKPPGLIRRAYEQYGIRTFAFDSAEELQKNCEATGGARDLQLMLRLAASGAGSLIPLEGKFGAGPEDAPALLRAARAEARELGVTFHIGSQAMEPDRFRDMLGAVSGIVRDAGVVVDRVDVGGGFPARYPGIEPPALGSYLAAIEAGARGLAPGTKLSCEPGRALVAEAESVIVRVDARRSQRLYINDGAFGTLYDAVHSGFSYPVRLIRDGRTEIGPLEPFTLYGPSCDSADRVPDPVALPGSVAEGDYLEIGQIGAYGRVMATRFNGFGVYDEAILEDAPMLSMYDAETVAAPCREMTAGLAQGA